MRFLADESCDFVVVRALRESGYDVLSVSEISPRAEDAGVIELAVKDKRILLTEDKDFGQLVYAHGQKTGGVIFLRFPASARKQIADETVKLVKKQGEKLIGSFTVIRLAESGSVTRHEGWAIRSQFRIAQYLAHKFPIAFC